MTARLSRALPLLALALSAVASGCVADSTPLVVDGFFKVNGDGEKHSCAPGTVGVIGGLLDTAKGNPSKRFEVTVAVVNQLEPNKTALRTDTQSIQIDRVKVSYAMEKGGAAPAAISVPISVIIGAGDKASFVVPLLTPDNAAAVANKADDTFVATVVFSGKTMEGDTVESAPVTFPVELCTNCVGSPCNPDTEEFFACNPAQDNLTGGYDCTPLAK